MNIRLTDLYTLDCSYYKKTFTSIQELIEDVLKVGMDPDYEIMKNGKPTGERLVELITP